MITGKEIICSFGGRKKRAAILDRVSFSVEEGRITTFMGKSGAGKTTLLKCIANLHAHYEGVITVGNRDLKKLTALERATTIGYVFQQFHLFPHLTVLQNCTFALREALEMKEEAAELAEQTLDLLGMSSHLHALPGQLSGGQAQRAAIARALVLRPKIVLLDEPTSALDPESKKSLESLLLDLRAQGITLAISSHDMPFIRKVLDRVYYLEEGRVVEEWDARCDGLSSKEKIQHFLGEL